MFLEELQSLISSVKRRIRRLQNSIKEKENNYEEMRQAKDGLSRVEDMFQSKKKQHQDVYNNDLFRRNRCLQRLSASMTNHLAGNKTSVSDGIDDVDNRMSKLRDEIDDDENTLAGYERDLDSYESQSKTAVSKYSVGG